jgi:hypothetical protein
MMIQSKPAITVCPGMLEVNRQNAKVAFDDLLRFLRNLRHSILAVRKLSARVAVLGRADGVQGGAELGAGHRDD